MNAWDNLPNAKHIDRVLASLKANPDKWNAARAMTRNTVSESIRNAAFHAAWNAAWNAAYFAGRDAAWNAGRNAAFHAAWRADYHAARNAVRLAIAGLIAYDDCAHMLDSTPDELFVLHALGDERAILFISTAIVFSEEKVTEVV